ncbi:MAG TPA: flagellin [Acetobacteraceae bacterium]|jgi:flagellar hook-associated protein 3 FlgL|nr:flagellin [Acetobacteraceae bacterium]
MSPVSGASVSYGSLSQLLANSGQVKQRLDRLTGQAASGLVGTSYAGLGQGAAASLALAPALAHQQAWSANIDAASGRMQAAQGALTQISQIASDFYAKTNNLNGLNASTVDSVAAGARDALRQMASLLDTQVAGVYVFAGQDSANPPVPNPDAIGSSGLVAQITSAVQGLSGAGAAATNAATLATASSNAAGVSPFSAALSQPASALAALRPSVQTGDASSVPTGMLASANGDIASTGASTTGSYTRDIMRSLAVLGALSSSQIADPGFAAVVADTRISLGGAITALNADAGVMGDRQAALTRTQSGLADLGTALQAQLANAQQVDMAQTLSALTQTQTQLQASYQLIAGLQAMSLVKFLPAG